ncbi:MAG: SMI1/KNR4 family protein [Sandaracinaceae bacterium]|nr:SMI1/KNR4 family protein [Sandaracinaceae bacterium]
MSSDCFTIRVDRVEGDVCVLSCLTGTAGGVDDLCITRSFALHVLRDAATRRDDPRWELEARPDSKGARAQRLRALLPVIDALPSPAPLVEALPEIGFDKEWYQERVDRFVRETVLLARHNDLGEDELSARVGAIQHDTDDELERTERMWEQTHWYTLEVHVTDPRWLEHLVVGMEFGTTAFDWWSDDPRSAPYPPPREAAPSRTIAEVLELYDRFVDALVDKAKPLSQESWRKGFDGLDVEVREIAASTEDEIAALEARFGVRVPDDLRAFWSRPIRNVTIADGSLDVLVQMHFVGASDSARQMAISNEIAGNMTCYGDNDREIKRLMRFGIPFEEEETHCLVDADPEASTGVRRMSFDGPPELTPIAPSFTRYLEHLIAAGGYGYGPVDDRFDAFWERIGALVPTAIETSRNLWLAHLARWAEPPAEAYPEQEATTPRVILATAADLGKAISAKLRKRYGSRPIWFLRGEDADRMTIFDRIEEPDPDEDVSDVMDAIDGLSAGEDEAIQAIVGAAGSIEYGLHTAATLEDAREAFAADGFEVIEASTEGVAWPRSLGRG